MIKLISMLASLLLASSASAGVCNGTFNMTSNGFSGFLDLHTLSENFNRETFQGGISMAGGPTYLVNGSCDNSANGGRIQFTVSFPNGAYVTYQGNYFFGVAATNMSGRFFDGRAYYSWSAFQSYGAPGGPGGGFVSDCAGDYDLNSNGNLGTLVLQVDGFGGLTGTMTIGTGTYSVNGICQTQPNGRVYVSFTRYGGRVPQEYKGYLRISAAGVQMGGQFTVSGRSFPWSANRY